METRKLNKMKTDIQIENLKCGGCASTIKKGLSSIKGLQEIEIDIENSTISVNSNATILEEIKSKLSALGYPVVGDKNTVIHKAKSFVSCAIGKLDS